MIPVVGMLVITMREQAKLSDTAFKVKIKLFGERTTKQLMVSHVSNCQSCVRKLDIDPHIKFT